MYRQKKTNILITDCRNVIRKGRLYFVFDGGALNIYWINIYWIKSTLRKIHKCRPEFDMYYEICVKILKETVNLTTSQLPTKYSVE